jgi:hypothetical protein
MYVARSPCYKLCILDATIVLEARMVEEHEWDEKAMLNIIVDENEGAMTTASAPTAARIKKLERSHPGTPGV